MKGYLKQFSNCRIEVDALIFSLKKILLYFQKMRLNFGITTADLYLINFPLKRNYQTKNKRILELEEIVEAHQFVEINEDGGKIVVLTQ